MMTSISEGTSRVVLDKTSDGHDRSNEYSYAVPGQIIQPDVNLRSLQSDQEYYSFLGTKKIPATAMKIQELSDLTLTGTGAKERFQKEFGVNSFKYDIFFIAICIFLMFLKSC